MSSHKGIKLIDSSDDSETELKVNADYAGNYDKWRKKEELQKLKDKFGDGSDLDSSSSESEVEVPVVDKGFFKALSLLKSKDPRIYDKNTRLFSDEKQPKVVHKKEKPKPLFLKDYERQMVLEKNGDVSEEENCEYDKIQPCDEEEEELKECFNVNEAGSDSDDDMFHIRQKNIEEKEKSEADYIQWLKGQKEMLFDEDADELKYLRDEWNAPNIDDKEKFLRDYFLNQRYLDDDDDESDEVPTYDEVTGGHVTLSDDEKQLEEQEAFEHKFNFRFEEPDTEFIKKYPRTVADSMRRADNKRKLKREEYRERKQQEKDQKKEEIKRLKALKRREIEEKIEMLKEVAGNETLAFEDFHIDGDFDPKEYDRKMQELFNQDYYNVEEDVKPEFPPDEDIECENWDNWVGNSGEDGYNNDVEGRHCEDADFNMDADYDPRHEFQNEVIESTRSRKKRKKSKFSAAVSKEKPVFDPSSKTFEAYFEEYYKLNCEDVIGDLPVRFKYREVVPNDFGLSTSEILTARDKELNQWCSLKKTSQYRTKEEEKYDIQAFKRKAQKLEAKKKILLSLFEPENKDDDKSVTTTPLKSKRKRKKKKGLTIESNASFTNNQASTDHKSKKLKADKTTEDISRSADSEFSVSQQLGDVNNMNNAISSSSTSAIPVSKHFSSASISDDTDNQKSGKKKKSKIKQHNSDSDLAHDHTILQKSDLATNSGLKSSLQGQNEDISNIGLNIASKHNHNTMNIHQKQHSNTTNFNSKKKRKNSSLNYEEQKTDNKQLKNVEHIDKRLEISNERLKAYGINPKKYKNRIIFAKKHQR